MRYRVDGDPAETAYGTTDEFVMLTVVMCVVIGAVLTWLGWHGRQWWLFSWSIGLLVATALYFGAHVFGFA